MGRLSQNVTASLSVSSREAIRISLERVVLVAIGSTTFARPVVKCATFAWRGLGTFGHVPASSGVALHLQRGHLLRGKRTGRLRDPGSIPAESSSALARSVGSLQDVHGTRANTRELGPGGQDSRIVGSMSSRVAVQSSSCMRHSLVFNGGHAPPPPPRAHSGVVMSTAVTRVLLIRCCSS